MHHRILPVTLLTLFLLALAACSSREEATQQPAEGSLTLNFRVLNYQQVSLDDVTRTTEATTLAHLDLAIYDAATSALVSSQQTTPDASDYGSFAPTLPYGEYILLFLGYDGSRTADLTSLFAIQFPDLYVPNLFYKTLTITVSDDTAAEQTVSLVRAVAAFTLKSEGSIPQNLAALRIAATGGGQVLDGRTGYATASQQERTYNAVSQAGKTSFTLNYYTFLPAEEATMDFTVSALDGNGKEIASHTFPGVPMKINRRSIYSGDFFATDDSAPRFAVTLENDTWDEQNFNY